MTTDDADPEMCCRIDFATLPIWQLTAFEAIRRGQMDVSEPRKQCSRTRVKDNKLVELNLLPNRSSAQE